MARTQVRGWYFVFQLRVLVSLIQKRSIDIKQSNTLRLPAHFWGIPYNYIIRKETNLIVR